MIVIKITNSGNIPITHSDYERPIGFVFDHKSKVLDAEVIKEVPGDLNIQLVTLSDNVVIVKPILLNEGDSFTAILIVSEYSGAIIRPEARIFGIKAIQDKTNKSKYNLVLYILLAYVLGIVCSFISGLLYYIAARIMKLKISVTKSG